MLQSRTRTFKWSLPTAHGTEMGWLPVTAGPGWYPGGGFITAHDVIEHLSDKPDWAHELRAAGVALFGVVSVPGRSIRTITDDILGFASREHNFATPVAAERWNKPLPEYHEARLQRFANFMRDRIRVGMRHAEEAGAVIPQEAIDNAPTFVDRALPWFRLGYRGAMRVYTSGEALGHLLDAVRDAVNKDHDDLAPIRGDTLTVTVDTKARTFDIKRQGNEKLSRREREKRAVMDGIDSLFAPLLMRPLNAVQF